MKISKFSTIVILLLTLTLGFAEDKIVSISSMSVTQDSIYGNVFQGSFNLPQEVDSTSKVFFAQIRLHSNNTFADSSEIYLTELIPLNSDGSINKSYTTTNILSLKQNGNVYFDITKLINDWKNGSFVNSGFVIRQKAEQGTQVSPSFVNLSSGDFAEVKIVYLN